MPYIKIFIAPWVVMACPFKQSTKGWGVGGEDKQTRQKASHFLGNEGRKI